FVWIMQWTDLLNVGVEGLLNLGIVPKVNGFDFSPHAAFVHHLCLPCNTLVSVSTNRHQDDLMEPGSGILQEFEYRFLSRRNLLAIDHGVEHLMDAFPHIGQFLAQVRLPVFRIRMTEERCRSSPGLCMRFGSNTCMIGSTAIG